MEKFIEIIESLCSSSVKCQINAQSNIIEDLEFDSLAMVELLNVIEDEYNVDFTELDDFLDRFESVGEIWDGIRILMKGTIEK